MGLLKLTNVSYSFGEKILYKDAEFELFKGEHMGLIGKNGTGKTTLINMIIGMLYQIQAKFAYRRILI